MFGRHNADMVMRTWRRAGFGRARVTRPGTAPCGHEAGFTLIEVMLGMVLLSVGVLAVAGVFPPGLAASRYGRDQTTAAQLAQQQIEDYKNQSASALASLAGDYTATVASAYFDQTAVTSTASAAATYFTRDVQIQYWTWNGSAFAAPGSPYAAPAAGTVYVYRVAVAVHWNVRGQTAFVGTGATRGCVVSSAVATVGIGCLTVTTFISP